MKALQHDTIIDDPKPAIASPYARRQELNAKIDTMVVQSAQYLSAVSEE